jgi:hypothetical protein
MSSVPPRQMEVGPFRFEHDGWIDVPSSIDHRARPGDPKESLPYWEALKDERIPAPPLPRMSTGIPAPRLHHRQGAPVT